jgi:Zn-dependent peptidase ImmA (M78 family)
MSRVHAERLARGILETGGYDVPVDVISIANTLGIVVHTLPLEGSVSGMLVVQGELAAIAVNAADGSPRQRFSIAHEIGHYLLHRDASDLFVDGATIYHRDERSTKGTRFQEIDANAFAAELLMPRQILVERLDNQPLHVLDDDAIYNLAGYFGVSVQAMTIRLVRLGLLTGLE